MFFEHFADAVEAVRAISQCGLFPTNCRLLDAREAMLNMVAQDGSSVLLLGFESPSVPVRDPLDQTLRLATEQGGRCPDGVIEHNVDVAQSEGAAGTWKQSFFEGPYLRTNLLSLGVLADTFETAVSSSRFETMHRAVIQAVRDASKQFGHRAAISCRFTHVYPDAPAPYYTFLTKMSDAPEAQWWAIKHAAMEAIGAHGATVTHHHAVGRMHREGYDLERPLLFADALRATKASWDPRGILNPGVLIDVDEG